MRVIVKQSGDGHILAEMVEKALDELTESGYQCEIQYQPLFYHYGGVPGNGGVEHTAMIVATPPRLQ